MNNYYTQYLLSKNKHLAILIDPDKHNYLEIEEIAQNIEQSEADFILLGSSLNSHSYNKTIDTIKAHCTKPVILFPGNSLQITPNADAILNLSLISGRNPDFLIGEHVKSAMLLKAASLEIIPTGYMLIDGGNITSVAYMSNTQSIPSSKIDIAIATALAGQFLGLKAIYLEAGSGAENSVPNAMLKAVYDTVNIPIICGGGITSVQEVYQKFNAGASVVVVGTAFEKNKEWLSQYKKL